MKIPPVAADLFRAVAPVLGTALGGPLGGTVAAVAVKALDAWIVPRDGRAPTPEDVVAAVEKNAGRPELALDLKRAELAVKDYELRMKKLDAKFDLLKLEFGDRADARAFSRDTGLSERVMRHGFGILYGGMALLLLTIAGSLALLSGAVQLPQEAAGIAAGVFSLIGVAIGYVNGYGSQIVSFYFGSSQGSKEKTDQITTTMGDLGHALGDAARDRPAPLPAPPIIVNPAPTRIDPPIIQDGPWHQGPHGGQRWRLTAAGVVLEGETSPMRTVGQPVTVRRVWRDYGHLIERVCAEERVPLEILVATVAVESAGRAGAVRREPGYVSDAETPHKVSAGLTQTLLSTATETLGRSLTANDLLDPETSLRAGARYIAQQRPKTECQPPLVAAAYNAGGLYPPRDGDDNPWRLRSTGDHVGRFCQFYGDSAAVAAEDGWGRVARAA